MRTPNSNTEYTNLIRYYEMQRHMDIHQKRIKNVQPTLKANRDLSSRVGTHVKKQPLAEFNRIVTIDIQNKALLRKLTDKSPSKIGQEKPYKLIKNNRKKNFEQYRQKLQNLGLLKRIKQAKSNYQNSKFASERKTTQNYLNTISKYGYRDLAPNKTIMYPFFKRTQTKLLDKQQEHSQQNSQVANKLKTHKQIDLDTIICVDSKSWVQNGLNAEITYIIWHQKVTIQIDLDFGESMCLQLTKADFRELFDQKISNIHRSVKYNTNDNTFYLDHDAIVYKKWKQEKQNKDK